ncbi:DUF86 domain-containing protein [Lederbergia graminis]|uniref:DUF86 domain-containing protein n=1 Tax=Lederbergia graminis TaxID=735518 RepID=A0ABW0LF34_9BACI
MYFVDREKIEAKLQFFEKQLTLLNTHKNWNTNIERAALERIVHTVIDSILDVGNAMIDGFIMRDPGSYEDIVDILTDEKVVTSSLASELKKLISYRKMLVQHYEEVDYQNLEDMIYTVLTDLQQFPSAVRTYLTDELGPISAFRK